MHHSHFNSIHSTQIYLRDNLTELKRHSPDILISATEQTSGVGRRGNQWDSYDNSIAMSFTIAPNPVPTLTPLEIGLLVVLFFKKEFGVSIGLKWPNDLLTLEGKKCGGIIAQYVDTQTVVAGLGVNLGSLQATSAPGHYKHGLGNVIPELKLGANDHREISLKIYSFILANRVESSLQIEQLFKEHCVHINQKVSLDDEGENHEGIFLGIGQNGEALVEVNGECLPFLSSSLKILR